MKLYDEIIDGWSALLKDFPLRSLPLSSLWPDTGERNMILRSRIWPMSWAAVRSPLWGPQP